MHRREQLGWRFHLGPDAHPGFVGRWRAAHGLVGHSSFPGYLLLRSRYRSGTRMGPRLTGPVGPLASWSAPRVLDELVDAGVVDRKRRDGIEYPVWSAVHGLAVIVGQGPLRDVPDAHSASHRRAHAALYRGGPRVGPVRSELSLSRPAGAGVRPPWAQAPAAMPRRRSGSHCWTTQSGVWRPRRERAPASRQSFGSLYRPPFLAG
jgi:hypothetical protein